MLPTTRCGNLIPLSTLVDDNKRTNVKIRYTRYYNMYRRRGLEAMCSYKRRVSNRRQGFWSTCSYKRRGRLLKVLRYAICTRSIILLLVTPNTHTHNGQNALRWTSFWIFYFLTRKDVQGHPRSSPLFQCFLQRLHYKNVEIHAHHCNSENLTLR